MIAKITKGRTFKGTVQYVLKEDKKPDVIASNMFGMTPAHLTKEFMMATQGSKIKKKVWHSSLSLAHEDRKLSHDEWQKVVEQYLSKMGFDNSSFIAVEHNDTEHQHIHIIASRVDRDGKTVSDSRDYAKAEAFCRGIEKEYSLREVANSDTVERKNLTSKELKKALRTKEAPLKDALFPEVNSACKKSTTMSEFTEELLRRGVRPVFNMQSTGRVSGISYTIISSNETLKGSSLGKGYSFKGLQEQKGVSYIPERDSETIGAFSSRKVFRGDHSNTGAISDSKQTNIRRDPEVRAVAGRGRDNEKSYGSDGFSSERVQDPRGEKSYSSQETSEYRREPQQYVRPTREVLDMGNDNNNGILSPTQRGSAEIGAIDLMQQCETLLNQSKEREREDGERKLREVEAQRQRDIKLQQEKEAVEAQKVQRRDFIKSRGAAGLEL